MVGGGLGGRPCCTVPLCTWSLAPSVGRNDSLVLSRCRRLQLQRYSRPLSVTTLYDLGPAGPVTDARSGHLSIGRSMSCMRTTSCGCRGRMVFPPLDVHRGPCYSLTAVLETGKPGLKLPTKH